MKVAVGDAPGVTTPNEAVRGTALQPCGSCSEIRTPNSVWVPPEVSVTLTVAAWPAVIAGGALTATWRAPGVDVTRNPPRSGRLARPAESPTYTW